MNIYVNFSDSTKTALNAYFSAPQNLVDWPNQGEIDTSDARWATYFNALPETMRDGLPVPD